MSNLNIEKVLEVHHWNDTLFSFKTSRDPGFRFENGHFTMIGLPQENGRPLLRAYSIASANYEDQLEFFSIKVPDGPLTSQLQKIKPGDEIFVGRKPTGTLVADHLLPGKRLWLLSTGTGLAPFLSIIKDPDVYERFDQVILTHGVRFVSELAYQDHIQNQLPNHEYFGEMIREQLLYYPTVTREPYRNNGRLTDLMLSGKLFSDLGLPKPNVEEDRFMLCGSPAMLKDLTGILDNWGFRETRAGVPHEYVIERAFVEK
ncbi:ferredoxin--NADP reductase [Microbulbifer thermotolerans]|uniref:Ferredoxin--NADP reductase n=1 Tax=Microbulbifer thermotolerans TaxID=252514 RepID=A0AB35HZ29_MICTH|nr:ferredoxin--NADP reductase [Microbulbifer thermotolerans]MCX2778423.1 ferredoxin--NADP reductase [Microbulbifer thermotolerans]MCX2783894.1 ferredoxin--NADP reductase [Microbulbifer thermotolerans]MCX2802499.1 ferredoxin--NADP reductase [Microbulbifer thermotolerans]MCX2805590.1 ferredoxin--NADP reductase [Microbulbifer thermotolerans]MCX2833004.1 ferredoxin--NADP reductase [Microbulbifer thermotolerans]